MPYTATPPAIQAPIHMQPGLIDPWTTQEATPDPFMTGLQERLRAEVEAEGGGEAEYTDRLTKVLRHAVDTFGASPDLLSYIPQPVGEARSAQGSEPDTQRSMQPEPVSAQALIQQEMTPRVAQDKPSGWLPTGPFADAGSTRTLAPRFFDRGSAPVDAPPVIPVESNSDVRRPLAPTATGRATVRYPVEPLTEVVTAVKAEEPVTQHIEAVVEPSDVTENEPTGKRRFSPRDVVRGIARWRAARSADSEVADEAGIQLPGGPDGLEIEDMGSYEPTDDPDRKGWLERSKGRLVVAAGGVAVAATVVYFAGSAEPVVALMNTLTK